MNTDSENARFLRLAERVAERRKKKMERLRVEAPFMLNLAIDFRRASEFGTLGPLTLLTLLLPLLISLSLSQRKRATNEVVFIHELIDYSVIEVVRCSLYCSIVYLPTRQIRSFAIDSRPKKQLEFYNTGKFHVSMPLDYMNIYMSAGFLHCRHNYDGTG